MSRGPKGVRAGYVIEAEGTLWRVVSVDGPEVVCRLAGGSRASLRRFRARRIGSIWRPVGRYNAEREAAQAVERQ